MRRISKDALANIQFEMKWQSPQATHTERYEARGVNMWRDCLPEALAGELEGKRYSDPIYAVWGRKGLKT